MADQRKQKQKEQRFLGIKLVRNTMELNPDSCRRACRRRRLLCRSMFENLLMRGFELNLSFIYSWWVDVGIIKSGEGVLSPCSTVLEQKLCVGINIAAQRIYG